MFARKLIIMFKYLNLYKVSQKKRHIFIFKYDFDKENRSKLKK